LSFLISSFRRRDAAVGDATADGAAGGGAAASGPEPGTAGALVAAGAPVGERLIALRARVEELEAENTDLKAEVEAKCVMLCP